MNLLKIVIFSIFFSFSSLADSYKIIAVIDNDIITNVDLQKRFNFHKKMMRIGAMNEAEEKYVKKQLLDFVIMEKIFLKDSEKKGFVVDESEIKEAINRAAASFNMNSKEFANFLGKEGGELIRQQIRFEMLKNYVLANVINPKIAVSETEVNEAYSSGNSGLESKIYQISHLQIPKKDFKSEQFALQMIDKLRTAKNCQELDRKIEDSFLSSYHARHEMPIEGLKDKMKEILRDLEIGKLSKVFKHDAENLDAFMLCKVEIMKHDQPEREKIKHMIRENKLMNALKEYMQGLKKDKFIEVRI